MSKELVLFKDGSFELNVTVAPEQDTVWLSANQMALLFDKDEKTIRKHINNVFKDNEVEKNNNTQKMSVVGVKQKVAFYTLDVIISVGYRVKSQRGIAFRKWANGVLKQYLLQGYAVNNTRLEALQQVVTLQSRIIAGTVGIDADDVLSVIQQYSRALELLDSYDHHTIPDIKGSPGGYRLDYDECMGIIHKMDFSKTSPLFGIEKEPGKLGSILSAIYQSAFEHEVYPSIEEKAANLLYFIIKDHPFNDGCKRIAATLFLYFLDKNGLLYQQDKVLISNSALVAITLMIAESNPKEKDIMIQVIINFLHW
jgi:prophage maintenance system killer protein